MECNHNLIFCTQTIANKSIWIRKQCTKCGLLESKVYKQKEIKDISKLYEYSIENWNKYKMQKSFLRQLKVNHYLNYLRSKEWQILREQVIKRDSVCTNCMQPANDVHHLHYDNFTKEKLEDLILLCRECHEEVHRLNPNLSYVRA